MQEKNLAWSTRRGLDAKKFLRRQDQCQRGF